MSKVMEARSVAGDTGLEEAFTVQQAAQLTGLSEHTLRYYERVGLLPPVRRQNSSRHRRYSVADISIIETLACLRARDFRSSRCDATSGSCRRAGALPVSSASCWKATGTCWRSGCEACSGTWTTFNGRSPIGAPSRPTTITELRRLPASSHATFAVTIEEHR
jgi:MerR HTH family regulatory protein